MLFHTPIFFAFFAAFFAIYLMFKSQFRLQNTIILIGSYIFYGAWDYRFLVLIIISTVTDYIVAIGAGGEKISRKDFLKAFVFLILSSTLILSYEFAENLNFILLTYLYACIFGALSYFLMRSPKDMRKAWLAISVVVNLGLLGVFKYFNFFADSLVSLAGMANIELSYTTLAIVLPVGISFYTFQTMSYTIDVYRKKLKASHQLIEVSSYIAFFPQLVAGPIERGAHLLPQFLKPRKLSYEQFNSGLYLFLWGMFKKAVIADNLSTISDPVFSNPAAYSSGELLVALLAFTFQIYCDFSGYSDMARGVARALGFDLMVNFNIPYLSRTPSEFWRRWHISLSSWLRDYLYIPLGGNRKGNFGTYRNLFLTMLLGGLWHGASWTFVLWGVAHGLILIVYRLLRVDEFVASLSGRTIFIRYSANLGLVAAMFCFVVFTWLLFRAESFAVVSAFLNGIFSFDSLSGGNWSFLALCIAPLWLHDLYQEYKNDGEFLQNLQWFIRLNAVLVILCSFVFLQPGAEVAFLYFDF